MTISAVSVSDPTADADPGVVRGSDQVGNNDNVLAPGEVWAYTAVHTVTLGDLNAGSYANTATATGTPAGGTLDPATDTETVTATAAPAITVVKTGTFADTNTDGKAQAGELVNYAFAVTNTGNVTLTGVKVNDPLLGAGDIAVTPSTLAPGQSGTATASYAINQTDIDEGFVRNLATATGTPPSGPPVTGTSTAPEPLVPGDPGYDPECTDCTVTPLPQAPAISITKVSDISSFDRIDVLITYTIKVRNTGNVTLSNVDVEDLGADAGPTFVSSNVNDDDELSPNEEWTFTATYSTKPADLDAGKYDNTASVTATIPNGATVDDEDTESVQSGLVLIVANDDDMTSTPVDLFIGSSNLIDVLTNDLLGEDAPSISQVIMTVVTPATPIGGGTVPTLDTVTGFVSVPAGTPEGTYSIRYQICEVSNPSNCDDALVTVLVTCDNTAGISGQVYQMEGDTRVPIANANLTLIQDGVVVAAQVTGANGNYAFFGVQPGSYLLQVQDVNLNNMGLYPVESSLLFTDLGACLPLTHDFEYEMSPLPVLGDLVWYDLNGNGIQDEWYDANDDGEITKTVPDANGYYDYSMWEWLDLNGDGRWDGPENEGELNAAGFGQANSPNVIVRGPNGYNRDVIVGIQGRWRVRPVVNGQPLYGEFTAELIQDSYFLDAAVGMMNSGLIKNFTNLAAKLSDEQASVPSKLASEVVCLVSTDNPATTQLDQLDGINMGLDFGVNCLTVLDIVANDDDASNTPINSLTGGVAIANILANDTLDGQTATISTVVISVTNNGGQNFVVIDPATGSVNVAPGTPAGTYILTYEICEVLYLSNCDSAIVTVVVQETPTTISGFKFHDLNANGVRDEDEPGLGGWVIYADLNDNGVLDQGEPSTVSGSDGTWSIPGLLGGSYIIREVISDQAWVQSLPGASADFAISLEIVQGGDYSALLFGNYTTGSLSGVKFLDSNRNGVRDDSEPLLADWTIYIDSNDNGQLDDGEPSVVTGADGSYAFENLKPGSYVLRELLTGKDGWIQTLPGEENSYRYLVNVYSEGTATAVDFGNLMINGITGTKWHDINGNGVRDLGEPVLSGWMIYVDLNNNGTLDQGEPFQVTDTNGSYTFEGLDPGTYVLREVMQDGWLQTFPGPNANQRHRVELSGDTNSNVYNFGNALNSTIAGFKWHDTNVNGIFDNGENLLSGWVFYIDSNQNGEFDFTEVSVTSDENGRFKFENLLPGQYFIGEVGKNGWQQVFPANKANHVVSIISGSDIEIGFGNATDEEVEDSLEPKISTIEGNMWYDYVEDGAWDHKMNLGFANDRIDEIEVSQWKITLKGEDTDGNKVEMTTNTNPDGSYTFVDVPDGEYRIDREYRETWVPAFPIVVDDNPEGQYHIVKVKNGYAGLASSDRNIVAGNVRNWMDDLQKGEDVLYAGAYLHLDTNDDGLVDTKFFVSGPTSMKWDQPVLRKSNYEFTSFDLVGYSEQFGRIELMPLSGYQVLGSLDGQPGDSLVASSFEMPFRLVVGGEHWNMPLTEFPELSGSVSQMLPYNQKHVMSATQHVPLYDTFGRKVATMLAYEFMPLYGADFSTNRSVFGSAPAEQYPVMMENDGARHVLHHNMEQHRLLLGSGIETSQLFVRNQRQNRIVPKTDALQTDGVVFLTNIRANEPSAVSVNANASGYLYAWIDFNRDGIWTEEERIIANAPIKAGQNILEFSVPLGVASGESYARFRLCDCPDETEPVGVVTGGEVEDYLLIINASGGVVQGAVWLDINENGIREINEPGIAGIRVYADLNKNGRHDQGEPVATTNSSGVYTLGGVPLGSIQIQPDYGDRWAVTNISGNGFATVELTQGMNVSGLNFGLKNLSTTSIDDDSALPREFGLDQNYPNPFNPSTTVRYSLAETSLVQLSVYDMNGRLVSTLVNTNQNAGVYTVNFDATDLASGVYIYRMTAAGRVFTQKLTLIK